MYIIGKNSVKEYLKTNKKINKILISKNFNDKNIISDLEKLKIEINYVSNFELEKIDNKKNQGIILDVPNFQYSELEEVLNKENPFLVILDHLQDPHNFGAIIRTCEAAGVDAIIIPKDRSVDVNSTVMKTSVGALNNIKIVKVTNLNNTIRKLKEKNIWIIGSDMEKSTNYNEMKYDMAVALIIGSEGIGLSKKTKEICDFIISIPMKGKINSLNASVAAGILIYKINEYR